jgi:hypothetical protein
LSSNAAVALEAVVLAACFFALMDFFLKDDSLLQTPSWKGALQEPLQVIYINMCSVFPAFPDEVGGVGGWKSGRGGMYACAAAPCRILPLLRKGNWIFSLSFPGN